MVLHVLYVLQASAHVVGASFVFARDGGFLYAVFAPVVFGRSVFECSVCPGVRHIVSVAVS